MNSSEFDALFQTFPNLKIGVVGDVMLDTYWWGVVDRISPEAPVPVVSVSKREQRIGGAGNVALNLAALGAITTMISITGKDDEAVQLKDLLNQHHINTDYLIESTERITTNKIRIISRNQHMMRLDAEITDELNNHDQDTLIKIFTDYIKKEKPQLVILEDYNKGIFTENIIKEVIRICKENGVLTAVDPKRNNFFAYKQVDIFKPNLHELKAGLNILENEVSEFSLNEMHEALHEKLQHNISFVTLSEKGVFYKHNKELALIPTHIRSIADVSGAGDTVIAVAALIYAASKNVRLMAEVANIAGGLVCEEVGTVAINKLQLLQECKHLLATN